MTGTLLYVYLIGWIVASVAVAVAAWRLQDTREPAPQHRFLSVVAGAVWPLLIVALAEAGALALARRAMQKEEPSLSLVA